MNSTATERKQLEAEFALAQKALILEKKRIILYGVGKNPNRLNPDLFDLSVRVLGEILGYEYDELARDVVRWQNDTICQAGFYRGPKGFLKGNGGDDLVLAYRGGGKSTWGTIVRGIWYAVRDFDIRLGFSSEAQDLPIAFISEMKEHLETNKTLVEMFGAFKPAPGSGRKWEAKRSTIVQRKQVRKEPTFHAFGIGGQSAGYHYDVLFGDDLVTYKGSRTKKVRENTSDWYGSTYGGLQMRHTVNHHLGTPYFPGDLWDQLENGRHDEKAGSLQDSTLLIPAEYAVVKTFKKGTGIERLPIRTANSPTRLPLEALDRIRAKIGSLHYATQYLMDRSKMVGKVFNLADFGYYDLEEDLTEFRRGWARYCFFDLIATRKDIGDYFCGFTIAVSPDKSRIDCLDIVRFRGAKGGVLTRQRNAILSLTKKHQATKAGVEAVQMQTGFAEELQLYSLLPIEPVPVEIDKVARAMKITPQVEAGKVYLPMRDPGNPLSEAWIAFFEELVQFPDGDHDDTVDGFVGAVTLAIYGGPGAAAGGARKADKKGKKSKRGLRSGKKRLRARY